MNEYELNYYQDILSEQISFYRSFRKVYDNKESVDFFDYIKRLNDFEKKNKTMESRAKKAQYERERELKEQKRKEKEIISYFDFEE